MRLFTADRAPIRQRRLTTFQIIILGFAGVILLGTLLLMLPFASASGQVTPFSEALFTATSAVCVTGLVVQDTATYWSLFGKTVIILLIQTGGLGVVSVSSAVLILSGQRVSLMQRSTMQEALAVPRIGGIVRLTGFILKGTFLIEGIGALLLIPALWPDFGIKAVPAALFHSVSAFCNAGFDLMGQPDNTFCSLTAFTGNTLLNVVLMVLILTGGLGFLTWDDIRVHRHHVSRYRMQSKVILAASVLLVTLPAAFYFFVDFAAMPAKERILASLFQSVTARTAGFNTTDLSAMTGAGRTIMIFLMLIGGAPGSTAGGMKITTAAVLFLSAFSVIRRREHTEAFGRRMDASVIRSASTILTLYLTLFLLSSVIISTAEGLPMDIVFFETSSAVATVGLSLGLTPTLGLLSRCILIVLMFFGRVGGLTLIYSVYTGPVRQLSKKPLDNITVG